MKKLLTIRDVVLKVNMQYIQSAAQQDEYRTEPAFKMQGSYRDMNKLAERIVPIMNDEELMTLIVSHYENQAQTLTTGAQANLLKFAELIGTMDDEQQKRWNEIKKTFKRNLLLGGAQGDDKVAQIIAQMTTFTDGLNDIRIAVDEGVSKLSSADAEEDKVLETARLRQVSDAMQQLTKFNDTLDGIKDLMQSGVMTRATEGATEQSNATAQAPSASQKIEVINKVPQAFTNIIEAQFRILQTWLEPLLKLSETIPEVEGLVKATKLTERQYRKMIKKFDEFDAASGQKPAIKSAPKKAATPKKSTRKKKKS